MHRAIETRYKGYRFRSRLEARWAVFFDALGLSWEYEPEGFELPGGVRYLPDFRVKSKSRGTMWFEVKPIEGDDAKARAFAEATGQDIGMLVGVPDLKAYMYFNYVPGEDDLGGVVHDNFVFVDPDNKYGPWYWSTGENDQTSYVSWGYTSGFSDRVRRAIRAARGARFEFGENGGW